MEFDIEKYEEKSIPIEALKIIEKNIAMDVSIYFEEDVWTAGYDEENEFEYKKAQYFFLDWLNSCSVTNNILYAGSGSDLLPKFVFGENKVIHTSMEDYVQDNVKYFSELGSGIKVVADNIDLPFPNSSLDMVMFFGLSIETTEKQLREASRVLIGGGLIVCDNIVSEGIDLKNVFQNFEVIEVPKYLQSSEVCFFVLKKPISDKI